MDVDSVDIAGYTALHTASNHGRLDDTIRLLASGADPNALTPWNETPCHLAARRGYTPVVRELVRAGADLTLRSRGERTVLDEAVRMKHTKTIEYISSNLPKRIRKIGRSETANKCLVGTKTRRQSNPSRHVFPEGPMDENARRSSDTDCIAPLPPSPPSLSLREVSESETPVATIHRRDLKLDKQLNLGRSGDFRRGYWKDVEVVIHTIKIDSVTLPPLLKATSHPNLVQIFGYCAPTGGRLRIVHERFESTLANLRRAIATSGNHLTVREKCDLAIGLVSGLRYLHELSPAIVHGNLTADAVGITTAMEPKLFDWGSYRENAGFGNDLNNLGVLMAETFAEKSVESRDKRRVEEANRILSLRLSGEARRVCEALLKPDASSPIALETCAGLVREWMNKSAYFIAPRRCLIVNLMTTP